MVNEFNAAVNGYLLKDNEGNVQSITHFDAPYVCNAATAQEAAQEYLGKFSGMFGMAASELSNLDRSADRDLADNPLELRFESQKDVFDSSTVTYQQTYNGLPIWGAGVTIQIRQNPYSVLSSYATNHADVSVNKPSAAAMRKYKTVTVNELKAAIGTANIGTFKVVSSEFYIYQYKAAERTLPHEADENGFCAHEDHIELPNLTGQFVEDAHYVVTKVLFNLTEKKEVVPYIALIDVATDAVLYLRSMSSNVSGFVFNSDPLTMSGNPANVTTATDAQLNPLRTSVTLPGLVAPVAGVQSLKGNFVEVKEIETPVIAPPTRPVGINFNYNVRTDEFSAVNAYYNNDRFFRMVTGMGFPATYWGTTAFPVPVDHRGIAAATINAHCVGNGMKGIGHACYALAAIGGTPIGIADDWRVVLHELGGHGILYCSVNSPNFGFAHSAGDSFAAILNDPGSVYSDRFVTFPWFAALINRRHDRSVASGWAWGGANDTNGYNSEQIISTTMFRFYRAIGGDSLNLATRHFAARMTAYLLLRAIGNLTPTHTTQTGAGLARVTAFYNELVTANLGDWTTEGHVGGAYSKVLRWAFEKQGLFQPVGVVPPFTTEGAAPAVDVYINDGRNGEYTYQPNVGANPNIWNRLSPDGNTVHQDPIVGAVNYAYVKIKNRGTTAATGVNVRGFQSRARAGSEYPLDWGAMQTPILAAANVPANNASEVLVGPFEWIPSQVGYECLTMVVSAVGDSSSISSIAAGKTMPEWRLVPNDNNIGQRKVVPKWF